MSGERIGPLHVLDHQPGVGRGALWWCRCAICADDHLIEGRKLRQMKAGKWVPKCMMEQAL